jgi:hypothetical protein
MKPLEYAINRPKPTDYKGESVIWGQRKRNGHRVTLVKNERGTINAIAGKTDYWDRMKEIPAIYKMALDLPKSTVLDGELATTEDRASNVIQAMINTPETVAFNVFANPLWAGRDRTEWDLDAVESMMKEWGIPFIPAFYVDEFINEQRAIWDSSRGIASMLTEVVRKVCLDRKWEGIVIKDAHWDRWYRIKVRATCDVVVTEFIPGTGKYFGELGALGIGLYDGKKLVGIGRVGTGLSDELRRHLKSADVLGKVIEVEYQSVLAKGGLEFPRFIRFRDDKTPNECKKEQINGA